jgi:hypothetical protein
MENVPAGTTTIVGQSALQSEKWRPAECWTATGFAIAALAGNKAVAISTGTPRNHKAGMAFSPLVIQRAKRARSAAREEGRVP